MSLFVFVFDDHKAPLGDAAQYGAANWVPLFISHFNLYGTKGAGLIDMTVIVDNDDYKIINDGLKLSLRHVIYALMIMFL